MSNTFYPTQIGSIPTGTTQDSRLIFGRNPNVPWEAPGFGQYGRPDLLQQFEIFLAPVSGAQTAQLSNGLAATVLIDATSIYNVIVSNPTAPTSGFFFSMREVSVCETTGAGSSAGTVERKMMILASQTYPTGIGGS